MISKKSLPINNLISYWRLQSNYLDSHGPNNGGEIVSGANSFVPGGVMGNCADFTTANAGISVPNNSAYFDTLNFGNGTSDSPFSINMWVKFSSLGASQVLLRKGAGTNYEYQIHVPDSVRLRAGVFGGSATNSKVREGAHSFVTNQWYMITMTYNGSGGVNIYLDGELMSTTDVSSGTYVAMPNTGLVVGLGRIMNTTTLSASVYMCEVSIWSVELNAEEVFKIHEKNINGKSLYQ